MTPIRALPVVAASSQALDGYGFFIGTTVTNPGLGIPFYQGAVEEGHNLPFACEDRVEIRTARIHPRPGRVRWLERHLDVTQVFIGLGDAPFAMVLGLPNHERGARLPDLPDLRCFAFPAGHGIVLAPGTWHDFPFGFDRPVTCLTINSAEVVTALTAVEEAGEMDGGDVFKIDVTRRLGVDLRVELGAAVGAR